MSVQPVDQPAELVEVVEEQPEQELVVVRFIDGRNRQRPPASAHRRSRCD